MISISDAQRRYYADTAHLYDKMHVMKADEHERAFRLLFAWLPILNAKSMLDVGAGTGRVQRLAQTCHAEIEITGIEPVAEMRAQGHAQGIPVDRLIEGDATNISFGDDTFDLVVESAILHHIPNPKRAVAEMCRVARRGVFLSDDNHLGAGSFPTRLAKNALWSFGLWKFIPPRLTDDDGQWFLYTVLDSLPVLRIKFPHLYLFSTDPMGRSIRWSARHIAILATK